ncbi:MAG: hypothetical protein JOY54_01665 [Acidobacteriaceae bacterium]|nr:hypothetical protein [Acidobacteriaceae bacterium]
MRARLSPAVAIASLAVLISALAFSVDRWRHETGISDTQPVAMLPARDATVFFANLAVLREAGLMKVLAGVRPAEERDYQDFVRQTGFDYTRDVDVLAASADARELFFVARGRFDWEKLRRYAEAHGGNCERKTCDVPTTRPGRWGSFRSIESGVIGLAVSTNKRAVEQLKARADSQPARPPLNEPVWVKISPTALKDPAGLPAALRIFVISLQGADPVVISAGAGDAGTAFAVRLDATFPSETAAQATSKQLQLETKMLQLALQHAQDPPAAGDLTGLLTAGTFEAAHGHVYGKWPVSVELLRRLE